MRPLDSRGIPATAYAAGYERLREQAVSARPASGGDGLSVLARRGLAAWLHTRAERPVAAAPARRPRPCTSAVPSTQAIDILLGMARAHMPAAPV